MLFFLLVLIIKFVILVGFLDKTVDNWRRRTLLFDLLVLFVIEMMRLHITYLFLSLSRCFLGLFQ